MDPERRLRTLTQHLQLVCSAPVSSVGRPGRLEGKVCAVTGVSAIKFVVMPSMPGCQSNVCATLATS